MRKKDQSHEQQGALSPEVWKAACANAALNTG